MTIGGHLWHPSKHIFHILLPGSALAFVLVDYLGLASQIERRLKLFRASLKRVGDFLFEVDKLSSLAAILTCSSGIVFGGLFLVRWIPSLPAFDRRRWATEILLRLAAGFVGFVIVAAVFALGVWAASWGTFFALSLTFEITAMFFHLLSLPRKGLVATIGLLVAVGDFLWAIYS